MKTEFRLQTEQISRSNEPVRLNHQNAVGTTTRFFFSVAYHWIRKREKKTALPSQPTTFQTLHAMPKNFPSCQIRFVSQSIDFLQFNSKPAGFGDGISFFPNF